MKILELFSGTQSFSKVAEEQGHECFTVDINKKSNPNLIKDIMDLELKDIPFIPDVVWASPPCTEYSHAKKRGVRDIEGANKIVLKTLKLIKELNPKIWIIENPQTGLLKNQEFMQDVKFNDASYCQYGYPYRKQTRFWNNIREMKLKVCDGKCDFMIGRKHMASTGNGRKKYTDRVVPLNQKYSIPPKLCLEIIKAIETPFD